MAIVAFADTAFAQDIAFSSNAFAFVPHSLESFDAASFGKDTAFSSHAFNFNVVVSGGGVPDGRWFPSPRKKRKKHPDDIDIIDGFVVLPDGDVLGSLAALTTQAEEIVGHKIREEESLSIITILIAAHLL